MDVRENETVLTPQGYAKIQEELHDLQTVKRPALAERLKEAIELGDLSENFDYHDAKNQQGLMEARIRDLKAILATATVVEGSSTDGTVSIGSKVVVKDDEGLEDEYMIVGSPEADPSNGKISYECSMGAALMDHKVGDKVTVETPAGTFEYEIVSVE